MVRIAAVVLSLAKLPECKGGRFVGEWKVSRQCLLSNQISLFCSSSHVVLRGRTPMGCSDEAATPCQPLLVNSIGIRGGRICGSSVLRGK